LAARGATESTLFASAREAIERLREGAQPQLIIVDVSTSDDAAADVASVRAEAGATQLLAVGPVNDVHMFRGLLAAGAADYVPLPTTRDTLDAAIGRLLDAAEAAIVPSGLGKVAVVVGTRGGVGASTVAITLAWLLAEEASKRTALVDLDLQFGTLALSLDIDPGRGLRDALEKPERIDGLYLDRAIVKIGNNLSALSAEEPIDEALVYDPAAAGVLIDELRRKFDWVVIDLPRGPAELARAVLAHASHTLIVADSTLAGLRDTMRINALAQSGNPEQRVLVLKGGALGNRGGVSRAEFEKELGRPFDAAIPSDPKAAMDSANAGQPLPQASPASPAVAAVRQIMVRLAGTAPKTRKSMLQALQALFARP
jgi:pilus assembly protein CpaE